MAGAAINGESLMALQPDLIFIKEAMYSTEGERAKLDKLGVPYLVVGYDSMEEQINALHMIGESIGSIAAEKRQPSINIIGKLLLRLRRFKSKYPRRTDSAFTMQLMRSYVRMGLKHWGMTGFRPWEPSTYPLEGSLSFMRTTTLPAWNRSISGIRIS